MSERLAFCESCGSTVDAGARLCAACQGLRADSSVVTTGTGPLPSPGGEVTAALATSVAPSASRRLRAARVLGRLLLLVAGLLLLAFGLRSPALAVAGASASATVYGVEEKITRADARTRAEYWVRYRFDASGQPATGSYTIGTVYDVRDLPSVGSTLRVKYFAAWPEYNYPEDLLALDLYGLVATGVGGVLLFAAAKRRWPASARERGDL
jgi:hypothetical protein